MKTNLSLKIAKYAAVAVIAAGATASWAQTLTNGLIFYAPFGGTYDDIAGGKTGIGTNAPALLPTGGVGNGGYVHLANDPTTPEQFVYYSDPTPATTDFSFQIWVRAADAASAQNGQTEPDPAIVATKDWGSGANVGWVLARQDGADFDLRTSATTVFDGNWHQVLITYQRGGLVTFYRDGEAVGTVNISANTGSIRPALGTWVTANVLVLGQDASFKYWHATDPAAVTSFNGDLDEAAMWSRVLGPEEVYAAYAKGINGLSLSGNLPPYFAQQPQGGTRYASDNFRLSCLPADDRGPLTYQWYKGGTAVPGATSRVSLLSNLAVGTASYTVVVNDGVGSITSAPAALTVLSTTPIISGAAVYLNFDNNLNGQSGTTVNGTPIGTDPNPKYIAGPIGNAVDFGNDGSASGIPTDWAISLGDIENVYSNNWAFSLWVNLTNNLDGALLGNKDWTAGGNVGYAFAPYNNVEVNYNAVGGPRRDIGSVNVRNGTWHHVAAIFNRDANLGTVYVDGTLSASASLSASGWESLTPANFANDTLIGASGSGPYAGAGSIDDLAIWKRALTPDEVLAIYAQGTLGQPLTTAIAGSAVKPSISSQPQGVTVYEGRKVSLAATASGTTPLSYQWYRNGTAVPNYTNTSVTLYPATVAQSGSYTLVVTNKFGSVTSAPPAVVTVLPITAVSSGLAVYLNLDDNINASGGTTNNGTATGIDPTPKYTTGRIGNSAIFNNDGSGSISSDWAISLGDIESIYAGSWSFSMWLNATNANDGAFIGNKDWNSGGNVGWVFSPTRSGSGFGSRGFINYNSPGETRKDFGDAGLMDGTWHHVAVNFDRDANLVSIYVDGNFLRSTNLSATGQESLTPTGFPNDTLIGSSGPNTWSGAGIIDDVGIWRRPLSGQEILAVYVQGLKGQPLTTASATAIAPLVVSQPKNQTRVEGLPTEMSVSAAGTQPMTYQWRRNGVNLVGATSSVLSIPAQMADSGAGFTVVVTNPYGSATSAPPAILTVTPSPTAITNSLVLYLNFESNLLAQAGTAINGTAIGANGVEKYVPGIVGFSAARFDNNNSDSAVVSDWAVSLGDIEWIYTNSFSFSLWVKTTDTYGALLGNKNWYSGGNIGWCISEYYTDWLNYRGVGGPRHDIGNFNWADDQWHHVAAAFYREGNRVFTYVDGQLTAQASLGNTGAESLTDVAIMTTLVGSSGSTQESAFGAVDDLAMWTRPLNQSEIVGIYQAGIKGQAVSQAKLGAPTLTVTATGSTITLIAPDWAVGYGLLGSSTLAPGSWTTVTATRNVIDGKTVITAPIGTGVQYFRLAK